MTEKLVRDSSEPGYRSNYCASHTRPMLRTHHYALYTIFLLVQTKLTSLKMSNSISDLSNTEAKLLSRKDWPEWYTQLAHHCRMNRIWDLINPDGPDAPVEPLRPPPLRSHEDLQQARDIELLAEWAQQHKAWDEESESVISTEALTAYKEKEPPKPLPSTYRDVDDQYNKLFKHYTTAAAAAKEHRLTIQPVYKWITDTVNPGLLSTLQTELLAKDKNTVQDLVRALKELLAPNLLTVQTQVLAEYQALIRQAIGGSVNPAKWYLEWFKAYHRALTFNIPEVQGLLATRAFLDAVGVKLRPEWARAKLSEVLEKAELGNQSLTWAQSEGSSQFRPMRAAKSMESTQHLERAQTTIRARRRRDTNAPVSLSQDVTGGHQTLARSSS